MSIPGPAEPRSNVVPGPGCRPVSCEARAYCGPAHGLQWTVTDPEPAAWVELPWGMSSVLYRLVRRPHSNRPARDHLGNYLYVPQAGDWTLTADDSPAQVIQLKAAMPKQRSAAAPRRGSGLPPPRTS